MFRRTQYLHIWTGLPDVYADTIFLYMDRVSRCLDGHNLCLLGQGFQLGWRIQSLHDWTGLPDAQANIALAYLDRVARSSGGYNL